MNAGWIEDTADSLIKTQVGAGWSMLAGGGSVKEVLTKSAEISSLLPTLEKTEGGTERERGGMEEVVKKEEELNREKNRTALHPSVLILGLQVTRMPRSCGAIHHWAGSGLLKYRGPWYLSQSAQCSGKWSTWNPVSSSTANSELLRLPSQLPN